METGLAILTLALTVLILTKIHLARQAEQQQKLERVPVRIKRNSLK